MAKQFSTMKTNVGNMIQDTSSAMATLIGVWINDAYHDAWRRCLWSDLIDDNFTFYQRFITDHCVFYKIDIPNDNFNDNRI